MTNLGQAPSDSISRAVSFLTRRPLLVLCFAAAAVSSSLYFASGLYLEADMAELLPEHTPSITSFKKGIEQLGNMDSMVVLVEAGKRDEARAVAEELSSRLRELEEVSRVDHKLPRKFFYDRSLLFLDQDALERVLDELLKAKRKRILDANPLYVEIDDEGEERPTGAEKGFDLNHLIGDSFGKAKDLLGRDYLESHDGLRQVVLITPKRPSTDLNYDKELLSSIDKVIAELGEEHSGVQFRVGGSYNTRLVEHEALRHDLKQVSIVSFVAVLIAVTVYFSRVAAILYVLLPLAVGIIMTLGLAGLLFGRLNTVSGFTGAILLGLGIDFGIHILARYDEERRKGLGLVEAMATSLRGAGRSSLTGAVTTSAAFFSIAIADFKGFSEFGVLAGTGVLLCLFWEMLMLPALLALGERLRPGFLARKRPVVDEATASRFVKKISKSARFWLWTALLAGLAGSWSISKLEFEYDFRKLKASGGDELAFQREYMDILKLSLMPAVISSKTMEDARAVLAECERVKKGSGKATTIRNCVGIADFVPVGQEEKLDTIEEISDIVEEFEERGGTRERNELIDRLSKLTRVQPFGVHDLPPEILARFTVLEPRRFLTFAYPSVELWDARNDMAFSLELSRIKTSEDDIGPFSQAQIFADMFELIKIDGVKVLAAALLSIAMLLLADFRTLRRAAVSAFPLVLAMCITSGLLVLDGTRISFYNMLIIPAMLGIGVDSGVHLVHRYIKEGPGGLGVALRATGGSVTMSIFTTILGFMGLLVAGHQGLRSMGELAVLGLTVTFLATMGPLPAILLWMERKGIVL